MAKAIAKKLGEHEYGNSSVSSLAQKFVLHLEEEILRLRQDHEKELHHREVLIAALREEKAALNSKIAMYELAIMPRASRAGAEVVAYQKPKTPSPNFNFASIPPTKSRWQVVQEEHDENMRKEIEADKTRESAAEAAKE